MRKKIASFRSCIVYNSLISLNYLPELAPTRSLILRTFKVQDTLHMRPQWHIIDIITVTCYRHYNCNLPTKSFTTFFLWTNSSSSSILWRSALPATIWNTVPSSNELARLTNTSEDNFCWYLLQKYNQKKSSVYAYVVAREDWGVAHCMN